MKARRIWVFAALGALALAVGGFILLQRWAHRRAGELEAQVDAGGGQEHLGAEGELSSESLLTKAGETPEATLWAYYYYKDRGLNTKLRSLVSQASLAMLRLFRMHTASRYMSTRMGRSCVEGQPCTHHRRLFLACPTVIVRPHHAHLATTTP